MCPILCTLFVLVIAGSALAADPPTTAPARQQVKELPPVNFNAVAFKDAIDYLADISGANIVVNWKALEKASVTPETPITLKVGGVTFRKVLDMVLKQAGGEHPLAYTIDEGIIEITTQESEDEKLVTRVYGIQDLLFEATDFTDAPQLSMSNSNSGGGRGGGKSGGSGNLFGGGGGNTAGGANSPNAGLTQKERADEIIKMIETTIRPEVWADNGGNSKISYSRGKLIITAPKSVHKLIGG